jgi:translation initiation factor 2B subunit (eIF-2B alpha/beta/delta family)
MTNTPEVEEIVRFLRRFSDLMSTGHNADHLLRAANLVETLIKRTRDADELLHEEQTRSENNLHLLKSTEINCANLEKELGEVKAKLAEQQSKLDEAIVNAAPEAQRLLDRAEQAKAQLPAIETELAEARARLATFGDSHALVPISTLRHAEALFAALAREAADVVSQAMCEVGASTLERAILESAAQQLPNGTSRHAA